MTTTEGVSVGLNTMGVVSGIGFAILFFGADNNSVEVPLTHSKEIK